MGQILAFPPKSDERLRAALRGLDAALAEQRAAIADFRENLASLGGAVATLQGSLHDYRDRLGETLGEVEATHAAAKTLERTAEGWLAGCHAC